MKGLEGGLEGGLKGDLKVHLNFDLIQHFKAVGQKHPRPSASLFLLSSQKPRKRFRGSLLLVFCDCVLFAFVVFHFSFVSCGFLFFWCWCLRFLPLPSSCLIGIFLAKPPIKRFRVASSSFLW